jgi:hypothetical protein
MNVVRVALLITLWFNSHAQVKERSKYSFNLSFTGMINRTESARTELFNSGFRAEVDTGRFAFNTMMAWIYGKQNKIRSNDDYSFISDLNYRVDSRRFVVWTLFNYEKSYSLRIKSRAQIGSGLSYNVLNANNYRLNISDGILYERSDVLLPDSTASHYQTFRNSLRLKYKFQFLDRLSLDGVHFIQNSLSRKNDYILKSNFAVAMKLYRWINLNIQLSHNKVNRQRRENFLFTIGISIDKTF